MCGIVGIVGTQPVAERLVDALKRLEYRGYDSAGVATIDNGDFGTRTIRFETGRLAKQAAGSVVAYLDDDTMLLSATTAIFLSHLKTI